MRRRGRTGVDDVRDLIAVERRVLVEAPRQVVGVGVQRRPATVLSLALLLRDTDEAAVL